MKKATIKHMPVMILLFVRCVVERLFLLVQAVNIAITAQIVFPAINEHLKKVHKKIGQQPQKEL